MATTEIRPYFIDESYNFFKLPAELRVRIYNYLMNDFDRAVRDDQIRRSTSVQRDELEIQDRDEADCDLLDGKVLQATIGFSIRPKALSSQVLQTCKLIHREALDSLYGGRKVVTNDFHRLQPALEKIGEDGRKLIKDIVLYRTEVPSRVILTHAATLSVWISPPPRNQDRMPALPSLESVTLRYTLSQKQYSPNGIADCHRRAASFARELIESAPERRHFLYGYMSMIHGSSTKRWHVDICSRQWTYDRDERDIRPRNRWHGAWALVMVRESCICFDIKMSGMERDGVQPARWQVCDVEGDSERVMVWTRVR